jgi:hypothetical protein
LLLLSLSLLWILALLAIDVDQNPVELPSVVSSLVQLRLLVLVSLPLGAPPAVLWFLILAARPLISSGACFSVWWLSPDVKSSMKRFRRLAIFLGSSSLPPNNRLLKLFSQLLMVTVVVVGECKSCVSPLSICTSNHDFAYFLERLEQNRLNGY